MKKILPVCLALIISILPAFCANWEPLDENTYIDISRIENYPGGHKTKSLYSFWAKKLNDGSSYFTRLEKSYDKKIGYTLSKHIMDCKGRTITDESTVVIYDSNSQIINTLKNPVYSFSVNYITPNSTEELYYNCVCKTDESERVSDKSTNLNRNAKSNINWSQYMREVQRKIERNWHPPKNNTPKQVVVMFKVGRDGSLSALKVVKSSGVAAVDDTAKKAVEKAAPFRPLPPKFKGSHVDIEFTFDYKVSNVSDT